jgi:hypothetical protein
MQRHWSDNQVSCTAVFDPDTEGVCIPRVLEAFEDRLKALSFLPAERHGYEQPPYEEISPEEYEEMQGRLEPLEVRVPHEQQLEVRFCDGEECERDTRT